MHTVQQEGLPNITGTYKSTGAVFKGNGETVVEGALGKALGSWLSYESGGVANRGCSITLNAKDGETKLDGTLQNDVYGKSDHLTPYNSAIQIWKRIS